MLLNRGLSAQLGATVLPSSTDSATWWLLRFSEDEYQTSKGGHQYRGRVYCQNVWFSTAIIGQQVKSARHPLALILAAAGNRGGEMVERSETCQEAEHVGTGVRTTGE